MRIRTLLAFTFGAATGAGMVWLGDPDHGAERRREARRWAYAQGRAQVRTAATRALQSARAAGQAAAEGFRETRSA